MLACNRMPSRSGSRAGGAAAPCSTAGRSNPTRRRTRQRPGGRDGGRTGSAAAAGRAAGGGAPARLHHMEGCMDPDSTQGGGTMDEDGMHDGARRDGAGSRPTVDAAPRLGWDADRDGAPGGSPGDANLVELIGTVVTQRWRGRERIAF